MKVKADEDACQNGAERQLEISVVAPRFETLGRRSKKSGGTGFGCNDGSENCPPGN